MMYKKNFTDAQQRKIVIEAEDDDCLDFRATHNGVEVASLMIREFHDEYYVNAIEVNFAYQRAGIAQELFKYAHRGFKNYYQKQLWLENWDYTDEIGRGMKPPGKAFFYGLLEKKLLDKAQSKQMSVEYGGMGGEDDY